MVGGTLYERGFPAFHRHHHQGAAWTRQCEYQRRKLVKLMTNGHSERAIVKFVLHSDLYWHAYTPFTPLRFYALDSIVASLRSHAPYPSLGAMHRMVKDLPLPTDFLPDLYYVMALRFADYYGTTVDTRITAQAFERRFVFS